MPAINRFLRDVMIAVGNACGTSRLHVAIYNVLNACGLFRHIRPRTRRGMRGGGAARRYFSVKNRSLLGIIRHC